MLNRDKGASQSKIIGTLTKYDADILLAYDSILKNAIEGKIFMGFWTCKKVEFYPTSRQNSTMLSDDTKTYIFGGFSTTRCKDIWQLSPLVNEAFEWECISEGHVDLEPRYGSAGCLYNNKIYIFGGFGDYFKSVKTRKVYGDMWCYDLQSNMWNQIKGLNSNIFAQRAFPASCLMDGVLFMHGGTNGITKGVYSDMGVYNIDISTWVEVVQYTPIKKNPKLEELHMHTATSVLPAWLKQRNDLPYFTNFHKWKFVVSDPINVTLLSEFQNRNICIWRNEQQRRTK